MAVTMILLIYPFAKWFGLVGGQLAALVAVLVGYASQLERVQKVTGLDLRRYAKSFAISGATAIMLAFGLLAARPLVLGHPVFNITVGVAGCALAYAFGFTVVIRRYQKEVV